MKKTSVYLPEALKDRLAEVARRTGRSEAQLVRLAVERLVHAEPGATTPIARREDPVAARHQPGPLLVGVGVGPGDPGLMTVRAVEVLRGADRVLAPSTSAAAIGRAEAIVRGAAPEVVIERITFAMEVSTEARDTALAAAADRVVECLDAGERVAFITLGDPSVYSTFGSVAAGVTERRPATPIEVVPGVMAFQDLAARSRITLVDGAERLVLVPDARRGGRRRRGRGRRRPERRGRRVQGRRPAPRARRPARGPRPARRERAGRAAGPAGRAGRALGRGCPAARVLPGDHRRPTGPPVISFVGAGPGAADLLTVRAVDRLGGAEVVVWASSLVPEEVLGHVRPEAVVHDSAGMTFEDVVGVYQAHPDAAIVRLHSGDVSLYSALQEQVDWCLAEDRAFEIVPGVGSLAAASALLARELTIPGVAQSLVATRLGGRTAASMPATETVAGFVAHGTTMAIYLSGARPEELQASLLADGSGYTPSTPAAIVVRATWSDERVHLTTVGDLADALRADGARTTVLVLVGPALDGAAPRCRLYDPAYAHGHRRRSTAGSTEGRPR